MSKRNESFIKPRNRASAPGAQLLSDPRHSAVPAAPDACRVEHAAATGLLG